jgi:hypothetical protein
MSNEHLLEALNSLNEKLSKKGIELEVKACGGYAIGRWTGYFTRDIDSVKRLNTEIKQLVQQVSDEDTELSLDDDWLNDDWGVFLSKTRASRTVDEHISWESEPYVELSNLSITFARFESLLAMKYIAIVERSKHKDEEDFKSLYRINKLDLTQFKRIMRDHGLTDYDLEDIPSVLYEKGLISEKEYIDNM